MYPENLSKNDAEDPWTKDSFSHNMEFVTYDAIRFINETLDNNETFVLYLNPTVPHGSNPVKRALAKFDCKDIPDPNYDWPEGIGYPWIQGMIEDGNCTAYRQSVKDRANGDEDALGKI